MSVKLLLVLAMLLAGCGGEFNLEEASEACQMQLSEDVQPNSGVPIADAIDRFLDCEGITWLELLRGLA